MAETAERRQRSANFSSNETETLIQLVLKFSKIIISKRCDQAAWKDKERAWNQITKRFNFLVRGPEPRSVKSLRTKYEALKKELRAQKKKKKASGNKSPNKAKLNLELLEDELMRMIMSTEQPSIEGMADTKKLRLKKSLSSSQIGKEVAPPQSSETIFVDSGSIVTRLDDSDTPPPLLTNECWSDISDLEDPLEYASGQSTSVWNNVTSNELLLHDNVPNASTTIKTKHGSRRTVASNTVSDNLSNLQLESTKLEVERKKEEMKILMNKSARELELLDLEIESKKIAIQIQMLRLKKLNGKAANMNNAN